VDTDGKDRVAAADQVLVHSKCEPIRNTQLGVKNAFVVHEAESMKRRVTLTEMLRIGRIAPNGDFGDIGHWHDPRFEALVRRMNLAR
jgi:hypothetical protein